MANEYDGGSELLANILPELARELAADLRRARRPELAAQIPHLIIVDRCRCGSAVCGTLICQRPDAEASHAQFEATIMLENGANVDVAAGRIVSIETLSPDVDAVIVRFFP